MPDRQVMQSGSVKAIVLVKQAYTGFHATSQNIPASDFNRHKGRYFPDILSAKNGKTIVLSWQFIPFCFVCTT